MNKLKKLVNDVKLQRSVNDYMGSIDNLLDQQNQQFSF